MKKSIIMNGKIKALVIFLFIVLSGFTSIHKYYVSVTDVEYSGKSKALQITSRLFIDDFEKVLHERYENSIKIDNQNKADYYIASYYTKKFVVTVNKQPQKLKFIGKEIEDDMVVSYFEIENVPTINTLAITNKLLFDQFEGQQNITHIKINNTKKSFLLIKDKPSGLLNL